MSGPLEGVRVVDLSQIVSGPMAACWLADQGADVIKVETPGGDPARYLRPGKGDRSAMFIAINRGKRSAVLDLKSEEGGAALSKLIEQADVLVENFRPGAMERLGFGYEACRALNPRLIFASITGFGPDGPYANLRTYDPMVQAVSGIAAGQTDAEGNPSLVASLICDKTTALVAAQAITAALYAREKTGAGQRIDIAMLDAAVAFNWPEGMYNHVFLDDPPRAAPEQGRLNRLRNAKDGQVVLALVQQAEFEALADALGRIDWLEDERFATTAARMKNGRALADELDTAIGDKPITELMAAFVRTGSPAAVVNLRDAVPDDPQVRHNRLVEEVDDPAAGRIRVARHPARFSGTPVRFSPLAPTLGEHSGGSF